MNATAMPTPLLTAPPAVVEDRDLSLWVREPGTDDSYRLWLGDRDQVRTLDELRAAFGPIYPAGSAL